MSQKTEKDSEMIHRAPVWMWAVAVLGATLVFGSIAFMLYEAVAGDKSPPDVTLRVESIRPTKNGFLVGFEAVNEGGSTAEGLTVEGELRNASAVVETSSTTLEYLPSHSKRQGGLFFSSDPHLYELRLRAKGYEKP